MGVITIDRVTSEERVAAQRELGRLLRRLRESAGLIQSAVSRQLVDECQLRVATSGSHLSRIERGESVPKEDVLTAILKITRAGRQDTRQAHDLLQQIDAFQAAESLQHQRDSSAESSAAAIQVLPHDRLSTDAAVRRPPAGPVHARPLENNAETPKQESASPDAVVLPETEMMAPEPLVPDRPAEVAVQAKTSPDAHSRSSAPGDAGLSDGQAKPAGLPQGDIRPLPLKAPAGKAHLRRPAWWISGAAVVVLIVVGVIVLWPKGETTTVASGPTQAPPTSSKRPNVPCSPPRATTEPPPAQQSRSASIAVAKDAAGHAQLLLEKRQFVISDGKSDGCAIILRVKIGGHEVGPWANSKGKTGRIIDGVPITPHIVDGPWLNPGSAIEFRVCVGETDNGKFKYAESDRAAWLRMN
jgi:transcriptional regulator with XRE-family HTH domain